MTHELTCLETDGVSRENKVSFWSKSLAELCGSLNVDTFGSKTIEGRIEYGAIGSLKICQIEVSRHRLTISPSSSPADNPQVVKVVLQMKGESVFEQDGKFLTIYPGDCIAYDLSRPHVISSSSSTKHLVVIIPKNLALLRGFKLNDIATQHFSSREGIGRLTYDMVGSVFRQMTSITPECEEEVAESILRALYLPFLERRHIARPGEVLKQRAKTYIWRNIRDSDLCIDRIATSLNCTKRYLHMVFANEGTTIAKYIWMVRLERCREELEQSRNGFATITDLAFSWGFNSSSHFSRMFKDRFGVPPSHLQRQ